MTINVWSDSMQHIELLGKPALFSDSRVNRSTVPDGWYVYDLRGSDYDPDLISTLEARVTTARPSSATAGVRTDSRRSTRSRQPLSGASSPGFCWDTASGRSPPT